ncbi:MAG: hypothetical protein AAGI17_01115 [Planctomycetota bacterium]
MTSRQIQDSGTSFSRRLAYFAIGIAIGLVMLGFFRSAARQEAAQREAEREADQQTQQTLEITPETPVKP